MGSRTVALLAVLGLVAAGPLAAQLPFDGCIDRSDRPVRGIIDNNMGWAGTATEVNGESVIYWNQSANARASRATQIFIYLHECGHHTLGHIWKPQSARWELEAECWAAQLMWESGMIQGRHLRQIEEELSTYKGDATHLGGKARRQSLGDCIDLKTDRKAWAVALTSLLDASDDNFESIQGQAVPRPSSRTGVYESEVDLPGTYDCEITRDRDVRCLVFAARDQKRVEERFAELERIVAGWVPAGWKPADQAAADSGIAREYAMADSASRSRVKLVATNTHRILFFMHAAGAVADPPPSFEPVAFRQAAPQAEAPAAAPAEAPVSSVALPQGVAVRVRVPKLGGGWILGRVVRTASANPCMLFELQRQDANGRTQLVFLRGVTAIQVDGRMRGGPIANLPPAAEADWKAVELAVARRQDAGCRR